jgi:hypothetical protein
VIRKKCVSCSYVKSKEKLIIMLKEYYTEVNRLFVFQCFSDVFKRGFYKVEKSSLGLAERDRVNKKKEVVSKEAYKL